MCRCADNETKKIHMFDFSRSKNTGEVKIACDRFYFMNHESQINKISEKLINKKKFWSLDILKKVIFV